MNKSFLTQRVNFILSTMFIGSAALLGMVLIFEVGGMDNPVANRMSMMIRAADL